MKKQYIVFGLVFLLSLVMASATVYYADNFIDNSNLDRWVCPTVGHGVTFKDGVAHFKGLCWLNLTTDPIVDDFYMTESLSTGSCANNGMVHKFYDDTTGDFADPSGTVTYNFMAKDNFWTYHDGAQFNNVMACDTALWYNFTYTFTFANDQFLWFENETDALDNMPGSASGDVDAIRTPLFQEAVGFNFTMSRLCLADTKAECDTALAPVVPDLPPTFTSPINISDTFEQFKLLSANITIADDDEVSHYWFSTNNSGAWVNASFVSVGAASVDVETEINISLAADNTLCWRYFANDSGSQINSSKEFCFVVADLSGARINLTFADENYDRHSSTFDELELMFVLFNWTDNRSDASLTESDGVCNVTFSQALVEKMAVNTNFSLCSTCDFSTFTEEFSQVLNGVEKDIVHFRGCHEQNALGDVDINVQCGAVVYNETLAAADLPLCSSPDKSIFINTSVCNAATKFNISLTFAGNNPQRKRIEDLNTDRSYMPHTNEGDKGQVIFNATLNLWQTLHLHSYIEHGFRNVTANCLHATNPLFNTDAREEFLIVNAFPSITFNQVNNSQGIFALSNDVILEYASGVYQWLVSVIDDDLVNINYTFRNTSGDMMLSVAVASPFTITTNDSFFVLRQGNPFNLTVIATDSFGNITQSSIRFNVTDTLNPICTGFDDASLVENATYNWTVVCTDNNFFSLELSCDNGFVFSNVSGLNVQSFNFENSTILNDTIVCNFEYCDGHTIRIIDDMIITKSADNQRVVFDNKIFIDANEDLIKFDAIKEKDRYIFDISLKQPTNSLWFVITSDEYIYIMDDKDFRGWLVTGDYWLDFESDNLLSARVTRLTNNSVEVNLDYTRLVDDVIIRSIGKLNCISGTQTLTPLLPPVPSAFSLPNFGTCDITNTGTAIAVIGFSFLVMLFMIVAFVSRIPALELLIGFFAAYFGWVIVNCFPFIHLFFILTGLILLVKGIVDAAAGKRI